MKFALVNDLKTEATKGARGICINCGSPVSTRCGSIEINRWVHVGNSNCDPWRQSETLWHRQWQNKFPKEWQEIFISDEKTGKKHFADVRTEHDLIIKFQHSAITPEKRIARENFYKNMIWVVEGTRAKRDYPRFLERKQNFRETDFPGYYYVDFPSGCFPSDWIDSSVPVIFDFLSTEPTSDQSGLRNFLFCLLPNQKGESAIVAVMSRSLFIDQTIKGHWFNHKKNQIMERNYQHVFENGQWRKRRYLKSFSVFI